jgi:tRNA U34 5-methylaminomethyl-2-thiouridine-forming methyltransferase MnmC
MKREILITSDGSTTIHLPDWDEQYHSKHGAIQEAMHVFIKTGLHFFKDKHFIEAFEEISILEIGFGTGLNAFITFLETVKNNFNINYVGVEAYPISKEEVAQLNYVKELEALSFAKEFSIIHSTSWEKKVAISNHFQLTKRKQFFEDIKDENRFNIVYFDAFGARNQPELWTESIFEKMYKALKQNGVLVTYSAKGSVRRALQTVGFTVERLPGPPGKREMLRAVKS